MSPIRFESAQVDGNWEFELQQKVASREKEGFAPLGGPIVVPAARPNATTDVNDSLKTAHVVQAMYKPYEAQAEPDPQDHHDVI